MRAEQAQMHRQRGQGVFDVSDEKMKIQAVEGLPGTLFTLEGSVLVLLLPIAAIQPKRTHRH